MEPKKAAIRLYEKLKEKAAGSMRIEISHKEIMEFFFTTNVIPPLNELVNCGWLEIIHAKQGGHKKKNIYILKK